MRKVIFTTVVLMISMLVGCRTEDPVRMDLVLDYYIDYFEVTGQGLQPQLKVQYYYQSDGKVSKYVVSGYNPSTGVLEEQRYFTFSYNGQQVSSIQGFLSPSNTPYLQYLYYYMADGRLSYIEEKNSQAGINSTATFSYDANNRVKVVYQYTNGAGFEYEFDFTSNNITSDKTTRGALLCSNGAYTYDQHVNPLARLGYVDYTLGNLSANNKITESVEYVGCAFPSLIPQSYSYEYNSKAYPTVATTHYASGNGTGISMRKYYYLQNAF